MNIPLFDRLTKAAESRGWSPALAISAAAWVAALRMLGERYLSIFSGPSLSLAHSWFLQIFSFYLALLCTLGAVLARTGPLPWRRAQNLVGMGLLLGTLPPVIDAIVSGRRTFAYEYSAGLGQIPWLFTGSKTSLPIGETIVLWISVLFISVYTLRRRGSIARALLATVISYALVLVFLVWHSRWVSALSGWSRMAPSEWRVLVLLATAQVGFIVAIGGERRLIARLPQIALPVLFVLLGAALRGDLDGAAVLVAGYFALAGIGFALSNDFYDRAEDAAQGRVTPVDGDAASMLSLIPLGGAIALMSGRLEPGLALIAFAVVSHAYHADPLRLKCVFPLSYKTEGLLGGFAMLAGLMARPDRVPSSAELLLVLLVGVGIPAALVFKDFKDVDADAKANVQTAFVFSERHGWPRSRMLKVSAALLFVSLVIPAAWLAGRSSLHGDYLDLTPTPLIVPLGALSLIAPAVLLVVKSPKWAVLAAMLLAEASIAVMIFALLP